MSVKATFLCLAFLVALASAQFGFPFGIDLGPISDDFGIRVLSCVETSTTKVLTSVKSDLSGADTLTVTLSTTPIPTISMQWATASFSGVNALQVKATFADIIEFEPQGSAGYATAKGGATVSIAWDFEQSNCDSSSADDYWVAFTGNNGTFGVNCTMPSEEKVISGVTIPPTAMKCDYIVNGYSYQNTTSRLALKSQVLYQEASINIGDFLGGSTTSGCDGICISASTGNRGAYFDWVKTADLSFGGTLNVVANVSGSSIDSTIFSGFVGRDVYFTFDSHATDFIWDPSFGVAGAGTPTAPSSAATTAVGLLLVSFLAFLALLF